MRVALQRARPVRVRRRAASVPDAVARRGYERLCTVTRTVVRNAETHDDVLISDSGWWAIWNRTRDLSIIREVSGFPVRLTGSRVVHTHARLTQGKPSRRSPNQQ